MVGTALCAFAHPTIPSRRHDARTRFDHVRSLAWLAQHRHLGEADRPELVAHQRARPTPSTLRAPRRPAPVTSAIRPADRRPHRHPAAHGRKPAAARRSQASAAAIGAARGRSRTPGADEMNTRLPILGDDLRKRRLTLHQFGQPGRNRIGRHCGNHRRGCHEIDDHDFRLLCHQPCQRQCGQRDASRSMPYRVRSPSARRLRQPGHSPSARFH